MLNYFTLNNLRELIQQLAGHCPCLGTCLLLPENRENNSRTIQIFKGVLLIVIIRSAASFLGLHTVANLADSIMNWGVVAVIIIFQPELRKALEQLGSKNIITDFLFLRIPDSRKDIQRRP